MLTKSFEENLKKQLYPWQSHIKTRLVFIEAEFESILGAHGCMTRPTNNKQKESGRRVGTDDD